MMMMTQKVEDWQGIEQSLIVVSSRADFQRNFTKSRVTKRDPAKPCSFVSERSLSKA